MTLAQPTGTWYLIAKRRTAFDAIHETCRIPTNHHATTSSSTVQLIAAVVFLRHALQRPSMPVDPEEGLVTDFMLGMWLVFGADFILLAGLGWAVDLISPIVFVAVTVVILAVFTAWIGWRWWAIRQLEATEQSPLDALKYQYATGELSEAEFERRLDRLVETDSDEHPPAETVEYSDRTE